MLANTLINNNQLDDVVLLQQIKAAATSRLKIYSQLS